MKTEQSDGRVTASANTPDHYWYRQGKDDGVQMERERIAAFLNRAIDEGDAMIKWAAPKTAQAKCYATSKHTLEKVLVAIERGEHWK